MNKIKAIIFKDVDVTLFLSTFKKFALLVVLSSFISLIEGGIIFIPLIIGAFITYQYYEEKQRVKFVTYFLPFIFVVLYFTSGGGFVIAGHISDNILTSDNVFKWILLGLCAAYAVILCIWAMFKVQLKLVHFVILTILIPIPYLLGFDAHYENYGIYFFYLLWNCGLSVVLSLLFSQKKPLSETIALTH